MKKKKLQTAAASSPSSAEEKVCDLISCERSHTSFESATRNFSSEFQVLEFVVGERELYFLMVHSVCYPVLSTSSSPQRGATDGDSPIRDTGLLHRPSSSSQGRAHSKLKTVSLFYSPVARHLRSDMLVLQMCVTMSLKKHWCLIKMLKEKCLKACGEA